MRPSVALFIAACLTVTTACGTRAPALHPGDGMTAAPGGRVWYRVVGEGRGTPLLVIHGGPGANSCLQRELGRIGKDRPVIFYDQLGTGRSDETADTTLWNLPRFVGEVDSLRRALRLGEVNLLGHSWGGTVALEYALTHPNAGIRTLTLVGPLVSTPRWIADAKVLVAALPSQTQRAIATAERTGDYTTAEFAAANAEFERRYGIRRTEALAGYEECKTVKNNADVYRRMWGPSEFLSDGTLKDYDRTDRLGELKLPVLLLGGEFDEARPETLRDFQRRIPGAELVTIPGAAHVVMVDEPEATAKAIGDFLARKGT